MRNRESGIWNYCDCNYHCHHDNPDACMFVHVETTLSIHPSIHPFIQEVNSSIRCNSFTRPLTLSPCRAIQHNSAMFALSGCHWLSHVVSPRSGIFLCDPVSRAWKLPSAPFSLTESSPPLLAAWAGEEASAKLHVKGRKAKPHIWSLTYSTPDNTLDSVRAS